MTTAGRLRAAGLAACAAAAACWAAEGAFYGGVDAEGVLQESFFLPLGVAAAALGAALIGASVATSARRSAI